MTSRVYRIAADRLMLCVNAANIDKDLRWIQSHLPEHAEAQDRSDDTGLLALQGPRSAAVLTALCDDPALASLRRFRFGSFELAERKALVSRTGYTGADGFEIYLNAQDTGFVYDALLEKGSGEGLEPAGLGARDTLRLEAALPLYGHELDDTTSPLEAGLERFVKREAGGFIGSRAIERRATRGATRQLVGLQVEGRRIARAGDDVVSGARTRGNRHVRCALSHPRLPHRARLRPAAVRHLRYDPRGGDAWKDGAGTSCVHALCRSRRNDRRDPLSGGNRSVSEYEFPEDCRYSEEDEWVRREGERFRLGITDYAQCQLGDVVFIELPDIGTAVSPDKSFGVIESVKAVSDLFSPVAGEVVEVNHSLTDAPEKVNENCYGEGWILVIEHKETSKFDALMDASAYRSFVDKRED